MRIIPNENVIVSPADGKIVFLGESDLPEECDLKVKCLKISIFLDIFNVHVNRVPISGTVKDIKYIPGKFFPANVDKSSKENERNIIVIENEKKEKDLKKAWYNYVMNKCKGKPDYQKCVKELNEKKNKFAPGRLNQFMESKQLI